MLLTACKPTHILLAKLTDTKNHIKHSAWNGALLSSHVQRQKRSNKPDSNVATNTMMTLCMDAFCLQPRDEE
jgi:hypothetical protein